MNPILRTPLALCLCLLPFHTAAESAARIEIEAAITQEKLTQGLPDWRERQLLIERHRDDKQVVYGGLRETERYALQDRELHAGAYQPLTGNIQLQVEAGASSTHRVLPARYGLLGIHAQAWAGWGLSAAWRRSSYDTGTTGVIYLGIEHYLGAERFAYTLFSGGPDGTGSSPSHRLQWTHYYGERDWFGIAAVTGRETEHTGGGRFLASRVDGVALSGRHGLGPSSALTWEFGRQRQGELYTRSGVRVGLRHAF